MKNKFLHLALCALFFLGGYSPSYAIKAYPYPVTITQPDGSTLTVRLKGDEFNHYKTTEDGFLLKQNSNGFLTYATVSSNGETVASEFIAKNKNMRSAAETQFLQSIPDATTAMKLIKKSPSKVKAKAATSKPQKAYPLNGSPKAIVILVNFTDKSFVTSTPQVAYTNLLNQDGYSANGGTGSARDYFMSSTYGKFSPTFDVVGPYTLPNNMAYYGGNDASGQDKNPQQMVIDACKLASQNGIDFAQYDTDNDGYVDNVFVYYAGYNEAEGAAASTIWPHRWALPDETTIVNGKIVYDYSCTSELKGTSGSNMCGIGTFCHEFGHVLGLPDYYHTTNSDKETIQEWDIMDYGAYLNSGRTPPVYSVFDRFYLGYLTPQQVSTTSDLTLLPLYQSKTQPANTDNQCYLFSATTHNLVGSNPDPKEFFMVEYRQKTGWDAYLPTEGMLIWHIDYDKTTWDNNEPNNYTGSTQTNSSHMRVYLQPLSGSTTTPGTAFTTGSFTPTTWAGVDINRAITNITKTASNITFRMTVAVPTITVGSVGSFSTVLGTPAEAQTLNIAGTTLSGNIEVALQDQNNFEIKLSSATTWGKTISLTPSSKTVNANIQVRYNPGTVGNHTNKLVLTSTGAETVYVDLAGQAIDPNAPSISLGKVEDALTFPTVGVNNSNTKTLNLKSANLASNLTLTLSGTDASMFTVSAETIAKENSSSASGANITVRYAPTATGTHSATLTIGGGGLKTPKTITLNGQCQ